jgi:excisionase family DNA binding protein
MTIKTVGELVVGAEGPETRISGRVAEYLMRHAGLDEFRRAHRGADAEVDNALIAMSVVAGAWRASATGSSEAAKPEVAASSEWLSTTEAGQLLNVTDRMIRLACKTERLKGIRRNGRWRIHRTDLEHYRAARSA